MKKLSGKQLRALKWQGVHRLTAGQVHHRAAAFSPSGRWLCVEVGEGAESCWLICDHKGRPARVAPGPTEGGACFAADDSLLYGRRAGAAVEIWQLDSLARAPRRLFGGDGRLYRDPACSPDGRFLCYAADEQDGGAMRLWLLDQHSGEQRALPGLDGPVSFQPLYPAWAPAGDRLYFEADGAVYTLDLQADGGGPGQVLRLTPEGESHRRPAPLGQGLLVVQRDLPGGKSDLLLLAHDDAGEEAVQQHGLTARSRCARDPVASWRKGELLLGCAMLCQPKDGQPRRYDLYLGRLFGVALPEAEGGRR